MRDVRCRIPDADQIMDDLIPKSREDGGVFFGEGRPH